MTPTARKPGTSRTVCRSPMSAPSKEATSTTKLLRSADQVAKATGIAAAITNRSATGRRQGGRCRASAMGSVRMARALRPAGARGKRPRGPSRGAGDPC